MTEVLRDSELGEIENRLSAAERIVPPPWTPLRETEEGIGGASFIQGGHPDLDHEINVELILEHEVVRSPDPRLEVVIEFLGRSGEDLRRLIAEVRRLRAP